MECCSLRRLSGGSVWLGCLTGRPGALRRATAPWGPWDHPPITRPTDGEGVGTDSHGLLSENNSNISENTAIQQGNATMNKSWGCDSYLTSLC